MDRTSSFSLFLLSSLILIVLCQDNADYFGGEADEDDRSSKKEENFFCPTISMPSTFRRRRREAIDDTDYPDYPESGWHNPSRTNPSSVEEIKDNFDKKIGFEVETISDDILERAGGFRPKPKASYIILVEDQSKKPARKPNKEGWSTCGDLVFCRDQDECNQGLACCGIPGTEARVCMKAMNWMAGEF